MKGKKKTPKRKPWTAFYTVAMEVRGGFKPDILPLVEYIVGDNSDSSGSWVDGSGLWDAEWYKNHIVTARLVYGRLLDLFKKVRFPYVRLRLINHHLEHKPGKLVESFRRGRLNRVNGKKK